jgi:hypothetical protein
LRVFANPRHDVVVGGPIFLDSSVAHGGAPIHSQGHRNSALYTVEATNLRNSKNILNYFCIDGVSLRNLCISAERDLSRISSSPRALFLWNGGGDTSKDARYEPYLLATPWQQH